MKETLEWIHDNGGHIAILSDANTFYIDTILKHHGVLHLIQKVVTNKGYFDENNRLRVGRFHDRSLPPHSCAIGCPANLCKGEQPLQILYLHMHDMTYNRRTDR
jgi:pyridoxal phosphate phosphatase PHOSPHO2